MAEQVDRIGDLLESGELKDIIGVPTSERTYDQAKGAAPTSLPFPEAHASHTARWMGQRRGV